MSDERPAKRARYKGPAPPPKSGPKSDEETIAQLEAYREARPGDPYPDRVLARFFLESDEPHRAVGSLARLDAITGDDPSYAWELARLHRATGNGDAALANATRMVRIDPYRAEFRELAAAIAIEQGRFELARQHVEALLLLEPDRGIHQRRMEAITRLMEESRG